MDQRKLRQLSSLLFEFGMYLEEVSPTFMVKDDHDYASMLYRVSDFLKSCIDYMLKYR